MDRSSIITSAYNNGWAKAEPLIQSIFGYIDPIQCEALFGLSASLPDGATILEIGAFKGKSTACLSIPCIGTKKKVYSIDPFQKQPTSEYSGDIWNYSLDDWHNNMSIIGTTDIVNPIIGLSEDIAPNWNKPINMLFIDGAHTYDGALADVNNYFKWLIPGGIIAMHDVMEGSPWQGVLKVWNENVLPHITNIISFDSLCIGCT